MSFKKYSFIIITLIFSLFSGKVIGQGRGSDTTIVITDTTNLDALFKKARELAFDNNYAQARRICLKIIEKKPNYYDVRTFLGRIYAWEKQYDNARTELSRVLIEKENDYEALNALFDVEYWTESYSVANDYLKVALGYYPTSEGLLIKKARLQIKLEEKDQAALTLRKILDLNPGQKEAITIMNSLEGRKLSNTFQASYVVDLFSKTQSRQLASAELGRNFNFGSITVRGYFADKFNRQGHQLEIENYTHFTKTTYANLLGGYSQSSLFPDYKYYIEIYQKLPKGFEFSGGVRYLKFTNGTTIYTGSLANYFKDYYFSLRTFITPKNTIFTDTISHKSTETKKTSYSLIATIRTYFGDADNFFGIKLSKGKSLEEGSEFEVVNTLPAYQVGFELQNRAFGKWLIKMDMAYVKENIVDDSHYTKRISTTVTLKTVF